MYYILHNLFLHDVLFHHNVKTSLLSNHAIWTIDKTISFCEIISLKGCSYDPDGAESEAPK